MATTGFLAEKTFAEWIGPIVKYAVGQLICACVGQSGKLLFFALRGKNRMERMLPGTGRIGPITHWAWFEASDVDIAVDKFMRANVGYVTVSLSAGDLRFTGRRQDGSELRMMVSTTDYTGAREAVEPQPREVAAKSASPTRSKPKQSQRTQRERAHERTQVVQSAVQEHERAQVAKSTAPESQQAQSKLTPRQIHLLDKLGPRPTRATIVIPGKLRTRRTRSGRNRTNEYYRKREVRRWEANVRRIMALPASSEVSTAPTDAPKKKWPKKPKYRVQMDTEKRRKKREEDQRQAALSSQDPTNLETTGQPAS